MLQNQNCSLQSVTKCFSESAYKDDAKDFSQAYYEMLDFIYTPGYDYDELSYNEIEIIKMMISYLNSKADEIIKNDPKDKIAASELMKLEQDSVQ